MKRNVKKFKDKDVTDQFQEVQFMDSAPFGPIGFLSFRNVVSGDFLEKDQRKIEEDKDKGDPKCIHIEEKKVMGYKCSKFILLEEEERRIVKAWCK